MRRGGWIRPDVVTDGPRRGTRQDPILAYLDEAYPDGWPAGFIAAMYGAERAGKPLTLDEAKGLAARLAAESSDRINLSDTTTLRSGYERRQPQVVYYMRFDRLIKIGTTANLRLRLQQVPHDELLATEPGGYDLERHRHAQFRSLRYRKEWFRYGPELKEHIASLRKAAA